jgi:hypothetical protein
MRMVTSKPPSTTSMTRLSVVTSTEISGWAARNSAIGAASCS